MPIPEISSSDDPLDPGPTIVNLPALQPQEPAVEIPKDRSENSSHATVASGAQGSFEPDSLEHVFNAERDVVSQQPRRAQPVTNAHPNAAESAVHRFGPQHLNEQAKAPYAASWPMRMILFGCALLVSGVLWASWNEASHYEELLVFGEAEFDYAGDLIRVRLPAKAEIPVMVGYPGGRRAVQSTVILPFALSRTHVELGKKMLPFSARVNDDLLSIEASVSALYRLEVVDASAESIEIQLTHDVAQSIQVSPGKLLPLTENTHLWRIPIPPEEEGSSTVPIQIVVDRPGEAPVVFEDELIRPNLKTPLTVLQPSARMILQGRLVSVVGYTLPKTVVIVTEERVIADHTGRFSISLHPSEAGQHAIEIRAQADGRESQSVSVTVSVLSVDEREQYHVQQKAELEQVRAEYAPVSSYTALRGLDVQAPVLLEGVILARQRQSARSSQLIFSLCAPPEQCLVWIDYEGTNLLVRDGRATIAGVFVGEHTYESEDGKRRTVPRIDARLVVAL